MDLDSDINLNDFDEDLEPKTNPLEKLKPYIKPAIKIILVLVVMYILYYYFYGSLYSITINIKKDNQTANFFTINITNEKGKLIETIDAGKKFKLRKGTYMIDIENIPSGYYLPNNSKILVVEGDSKEIIKTIYLYPSWASAISKIEFKNLPDKVYKNQNLKLTLIIEYNNTDKPTIVLKGTNDLEEIAKTITLKNGTNPINLELTVPEDKSTFKGKICVDKTDKCTNNININIGDSPKISIKNLRNVKANAGSSFNISFIIDNKKNKNTDLKDLNINIVDVVGYDQKEFQSWFETKPLFTVGAGQKTNVVLNGKIPLNAKEGTISFRILLQNSFLNYKSDEVTLTIEEPNIRINKKVDLGTVSANTQKIGNITIENNSEFELANITATTDTFITSNNLPSELESWVRLEVPETIGARSTGTIRIFFKPTITAKTDEFSFNVKITALNKEWNVPVEGDIKGINFKPEIEIKKNYTLTKKSDDSGYENIYDIVTIKNEGDIAFDILNVSIDKKDPICSLVTIDKPKINTLEAGQELELALKIQATLGVQTGSCSLILTYVNPLTGEQETYPPKVFFIKVPE